MNKTTNILHLSYAQLRTIVAVLLALAVSVAGMTALPSRAEAAPASTAAVAQTAAVTPVSTSVMLPSISARCGNGRCTIYLSHRETRALGNGAVPAAPWFVPWQIKAAYYPTAYAHKYFARSYANRGLCSAFRLDIRPWATQGYVARYC
ncbi:hypothetical protein [Serinicoccus marinus]|uniref:hypothetical protein n=1 Tax=Serinicoccus marinus TaxID=247333 RepID=UPI0003B66E52|nr:hypothetical protein [Serinicoccus marinus]